MAEIHKVYGATFTQERTDDREIASEPLRGVSPLAPVLDYDHFRRKMLAALAAKLAIPTKLIRERRR